MLTGNRAVFAACVLTALACPSAQARKRTYRAPSSANGASLMRILSAENQRAEHDAYLATAIHHPTPSVRQAAIYAVARIGDASLLGELSGQLNKKKGSNKNDIAFALGLIPDETAVTMAIQHLAMQQDPDVLADLFLAIGRGGGEKNVPVFASALQTSANPTVLEGVCRGLGLLWAKDSESWAVPPGIHSSLILRARQTDDLAEVCSFALSRFKGLPSHIPPGELIKLAEQTRSKEAVPFLLRVLAKINSPAATAVVIQKTAPFLPPATRIEAIKALSGHTFSPAILAALKSGLEGPQSSVIVQSLDTLQGFGPAAKEASLTILETAKKSPSQWVRGTCLRAGMAVDPEFWRAAALKELADPKSLLRSYAAAALASQGKPDDMPLIATLVMDSDTKISLDTLEAISGWPEGLFNTDIKNAMKACLEKKDPAVVSAVAGIVEKYKWRDFGSPLVAAYSSFQKPDLVESKVAVLAALGTLRDSSYTAILEAALKDPERPVVQAAVEALRTSAKRDESAQIPLNSKTTIPFAFTTAEIQEASSARVLIKTSRGNIVFKMVREAPLNSVHFLRLVKKKFYDGLSFHRIIPNFVAQGGDPRGDGFGGPGYLIRDEVSPRLHQRGMVGLATSGKDTGGSQFFINLAPNFHLDGRYTVFAEVTAGMDVADRLEPGDKILSAQIIK